jgi:competence protein ComEC
MLLTGDVELDAQADLLHAGTDLRADVLKVPHHGSRYSAEEFLAAVRPQVAIVSVGAHNSYGQPSQHVLDLLTGAGARVMRTDLKGDIAVVSPKLQVVAHGAMTRAP